MVRALDDLGLAWFEIASFDPSLSRRSRDAIRTPITSCESLYGLRDFKPPFEQYAMDLAIIDVPWNGVWQGHKIAAMAEAYEKNIALHNYYGHLSRLMNAHLWVSVPNFRIMEVDIDAVPWNEEIVTQIPEIEDGQLRLHPGPGWGADLNE